MVASPAKMGVYPGITRGPAKLDDFTKNYLLRSDISVAVRLRKP